MPVETPYGPDFTDEEFDSISGARAYQFAVMPYPPADRKRLAAMLVDGVRSSWIMSHDAGELPYNVKRLAIRGLEYYRAMLTVALVYRHPALLQAYRAATRKR